MAKQHHGMCFLFVRNNYKKGDVVLKQGISTDWASASGHFALLRKGYINEYMPGVGRRHLRDKSYFQITDGHKVYASEIFVVSSIDEIYKVCKQAGIK